MGYVHNLSVPCSKTRAWECGGETSFFVILLLLLRCALFCPHVRGREYKREGPNRRPNATMILRPPDPPPAFLFCLYLSLSLSVSLVLLFPSTHTHTHPPPLPPCLSPSLPLLSSFSCSLPKRSPCSHPPEASFFIMCFPASARSNLQKGDSQAHCPRRYG